MKTRIFVLSLLCVCAASAMFEKSDFYSPNPLDSIEVKDAALHDVQLEIIQKRSFKKEIILFAFNTNGVWLDWALNFYQQLNRIGYAHHVGIATKAACLALKAKMRDAACVYYTLPGKHWENEVNSIDYLWTSRYKLANELVRLGVNVLVVDIDSVLNRDIYFELKRPPLNTIQLIHMEEGWANGGLFYINSELCQNDGPALWTHDEVFRRADFVIRIKYNETKIAGTIMDQALVNDAINAAASLKGSSKDWTSTYVTGEQHHDHWFWQQEERGKISKRVDGQKWYESEWKVKQTLNAEHLKELYKSDEHYTNFYNGHLINVPLKCMDLTIPKDSEFYRPGTETFCAAPQHVFGNSLTDRFAWKTSAITHYVAATADWLSNEWTHSGRRALMAARGAWTVYPDESKYLTFSKHYLNKQNIKSKQDITQLARRLFHYSKKLKRTPALFEIDCNLDFIQKNQEARSGVYDSHIIVHDGRCYPANGGRNCWHTNLVYDFEVQVGITPTTVYSFDDVYNMSDIRLIRLSHDAEDMSGETIQECSSF